MSTQAALEAFLKQNEQKELLRFSTAGSIDDGKSTLIGRLLHDSKNVYEDHLDAVRTTSRRRHFEDDIDFSLFTDGLKAEREQNITIDVAYRYFSTPKRTFIIADTPGHEQYTRNMATGASTANLAVVLVDARNGISTQTRRHAFIVSLLGVPHLVLAVNKMDAVGYDQAVFDKIKAEFAEFAHKLHIQDVRFIPISALKGDNVVVRSRHMPWFDGESLLDVLEGVYIGSDQNMVDLRFPVQYVLRPHMNFRGYAGRVVSGVIRAGDDVAILPSMRTSRVKSIVTFDGEVAEAFPPMSVVVTLEDERDISRGEMLVHRHNMPRLERHFEAMVVWMGDEPMDINQAYFLKHTTRMTRARIDEVRYIVDVNTLKRKQSAPLALNEIGRIVFTATMPLFYDPYDRNRETGSFILVDPVTNVTVAAGMIIEREGADQLPTRITGGTAVVSGLTHRDSRITPGERTARFGHQPATVWLTGLVGAGKTALAYALEKRLFELGAVSLVLDGENVRLGIDRDLDFSTAGRAEHLRRVAEIARLANDAGIIAICAFVSPTAAVRAQVGEIVGAGRFVEVHVAASAEWCEQHDTTGLYAKARRGEVKNVAGVNAPFEPPDHPALTLPMAETSTDAAVDRIVAVLRGKGVFTQ